MIRLEVSLLWQEFLADLILSKKMLCEKLFSSSDPHPYTLFWHSFWHTIWTYLYIIAYLACFDILSDIPSGILFGFYSDILSGILCVWHIFMTFCLVYLRRFFVVEVRRGTLWHEVAVRVRREHCDLALAVKVRQGTLCSRGCCYLALAVEVRRGTLWSWVCCYLALAVEVRRGTLWSWVCCLGPAGNTAM